MIEGERVSASIFLYPAAIGKEGVKIGIVITAVEPGSPGACAGIRAGERVVSINRHLISDVLDYRFYMTDTRLSLALLSPDGAGRTVKIKKGEYDDLGLEFETYLMDKQHSCKNKCLFCFIDQMPPDMRETLYFKDDDERLSFLFGNYVTLTNMTPEEINRIIRMRISPINVSVHTMNPELRVSMMKNPDAGRVLDYLTLLAKGEIGINAQLVLCPGINDGEELRHSLEQLGKLLPALQSVAAVPVGITRYREGLPELTPYTKQGARETIAIINEFAERWQTEWEDRIAYPADEFFLLAGLPLPPYEYYGDFAQLENGVGLLSLLRHEFFEALSGVPREISPRSCSVATGEAAYPLLVHLAEAAMTGIRGLKVRVFAVPNHFFGRTVTVAGLLTGKDLLDALTGKPLGEQLLLPQVLLHHEEDKFLDDFPLLELSRLLNVPVRPVPNDGYALLDAMLGL